VCCSYRSRISRRVRGRVGGAACKAGQTPGPLAHGRARRWGPADGGGGPGSSKRRWR
jgi:hypothetical protein